MFDSVTDSAVDSAVGRRHFESEPEQIAPELELEEQQQEEFLGAESKRARQQAERQQSIQQAGQTCLVQQMWQVSC